jgi:hypothetical protein
MSFGGNFGGQPMGGGYGQPMRQPMMNFGGGGYPQMQQGGFGGGPQMALNQRFGGMQQQAMPYQRQGMGGGFYGGGRY